MPDDLLEKLERVCERFGVPEPWKSLTLSRFESGRARYGGWNHLAMSDADLAAETAEEASDVLAFILFVVWSRAHHSTMVRGEPIGLQEEGADEAIDSVLVDGFLEFLRLLSGGENTTPTHERCDIVDAT